MTGDLKTCFKCGESLPMSEFYRHPKMTAGVLSKCKDCTKRDVRAHRLANAESVREYDRTRARRPDRIAARKQRFEAYKEQFPDRRRAHVAVSNALRDGKLSKKPCAFCGHSERVEAHHHDYAKPLDVTWLCPPCHRRFHALEQMATYDRAAIHTKDAA